MSAKRVVTTMFVLAAACIACVPLLGAEGPPPDLMPDPLGPIPPDSPASESYAHGGYALFIARGAWTLLTLWLIVASGLGAWLQDVAERVTLRPNLKVALYAVLLTLLCYSASFPFRIYSGYLREKRYGFMNQDVGGWFLDQGKGLVVGLFALAIVLPMLYVLIRRVGSSWWLPGSMVTTGVVVLVIAIVPLYVSPLFNTFEPLKDAALKRDILALAHSEGIPAGEVYQMDASRQSGHNNAYVTGLLGTQRIVLYDTLLQRFTPREIRCVMGHEIGHYVLNHIWKTVGLVLVLLVSGFLLIDRVARRLIRARPAWGIGRIEEPASLPLLMLLLSGFLTIAQPLLASYSRAQEHAADRFGLDLVRDPEAAASVFLKFGRYDLSEHHVHPLIEKILFTHPSVANRIRFVHEWARAHPDATQIQRPREEE